MGRDMTNETYSTRNMGEVERFQLSKILDFAFGNGKLRCYRNSLFQEDKVLQDFLT